MISLPRILHPIKRLGCNRLATVRFTASVKDSKPIEEPGKSSSNVWLMLGGAAALTAAGYYFYEGIQKLIRSKTIGLSSSI